MLFIIGVMECWSTGVMGLKDLLKLCVFIEGWWFCLTHGIMEGWNDGNSKSSSLAGMEIRLLPNGLDPNFSFLS